MTDNISVSLPLLLGFLPSQDSHRHSLLLSVSFA